MLGPGASCMSVMDWSWCMNWPPAAPGVVACRGVVWPERADLNESASDLVEMMERRDAKDLIEREDPWVSVLAKARLGGREEDDPFLEPLFAGLDELLPMCQKRDL